MPGRIEENRASVLAEIQTEHLLCMSLDSDYSTALLDILAAKGGTTCVMIT
jgi:hypothetical protein